MRKKPAPEKPVFIDANIFLSIIFDDPENSGPSVSLLEQVHDGIIQGATSVLVLNEVLHRLLIAEAVQNSSLTPESAVLYLKTHPAFVMNALRARGLLDDIRSIRNLQILGISEQTFVRSLGVMHESGLLSNDALHVASMDEHSIDTIATYDRDFGRVSRVTVFRSAG